MSNDVHFNGDAACDACGRFGAYEFAGRRLCAECYEKRGSCCPEFGADDLWSEHERAAAQPPRESDEPKP